MVSSSLVLHGLTSSKCGQQCIQTKCVCVCVCVCVCGVDSHTDEVCVCVCVVLTPIQTKCVCVCGVDSQTLLLLTKCLAIPSPQ